ncbi:IS1595 family transposase [Eggerthella guodeyinii]|uniref:IS1595 family transposase n=1 Tax=Eggerthella guodeyinii TaxID=2690837 RepID=A0A6N7RSJ9_9ACTN|nr:IS1595 family transposase [Eggerthella guodeyinii]MRX83951.1 IS1595 family transposase [Eggerthella guodeyinii]
MRRNAVELLDSRLSGLPFEQKILLIEQIRDLCFEHEMEAIIDSSPLPVQTEIPLCKKCGSAHVSRFGTRNHAQRYRCNGCGHVFATEKKRSLVGSSKLSKTKWMRFVNCFVDGLPIAKCAANCGVSEKTAYSMRLRVLSLIEQTGDAWTLQAGQRAEIDETFVLESFKGNRTKCKDFEMPRASLTRGRKGDYRRKHGAGLNAADHICIITGVDERRKTFLEITGRGHGTIDECKRALEGKLAPNSRVSTDDYGVYPGILKTMGVCHASYVSSDSQGNLNRVNALHSQFKSFLARKRGVSTRRLPLYLAEFSWRWSACMNDDSTSLTASKIVRKIAATDFHTKVVDFKYSEYPCADWWKTDEGKKENIRIDADAVQYALRKARKDPDTPEDRIQLLSEIEEDLLEKAAEAGVVLQATEDEAANYAKKEQPRPLTMFMLKS